MEMAPDGKFIFLLADGKAMKVATEDAKTEPLKVSGEMLLQGARERGYIFDHVWRQFKQKFLFVDLQGVDWDYYRATYEKFLPFINNNYDFAEMLSEMLGEVNASHTGAYYGDDPPGADKTADLGLLYDFDYPGDGVKVVEVVEGGPLDKAVSKIKSGHVIEKIDGVPITAGMDFYQLLNRKAGKLTLLSVRPGGQDPVGRERQAHSQRRGDGAVVSALGAPAPQGSGRALGRQDRLRARPIDERLQHAHGVRGIARPQRRQQALIVDTRFNGGGNIHEQLSDFLSGKKYFDIIPHGQYVGSEPRQVGQALDRADRREQLLRRAPVPAGLQAERRGQDARHAGAWHGHVRVVGEADRSDDRVRHSNGRLAECRTASSAKTRSWSPTSRCATSPT